MVEQFLNHIQRHKLCKTSDKILLAVSGGMDSMVMLDLFLKAGFKPAVAHCNFQLRGDASFGDEKLVTDICERLDLRCYVTRFDTSKIADKTRDSIQVTARKLRYDFFEEIRSEHGYQCLATAHHINDNLETVLMNLVRGTGIDGMSGIPLKNGWIIRPLLFASRNMLFSYANENNISWREDASNQSDDYQRNMIRNHIIPGLKELNPSLERTFESSNERIRAMSNLANQTLRDITEKICSKVDTTRYINIQEIKKFDYPEVILWELLKDEGVNYMQCKLIVQQHQPGKRFIADKVVITVDREYYIVEHPGTEISNTVMLAHDQPEVALNNQKLVWKQVEADGYMLSKRVTVAELDADKIRFPLQWRIWKNGDTFVPLGMQAHKKVSDLLIDEKISLPKKRMVTVLESEGKIVWVVGLRIHDSFKVTEKTSKVLIIECLPV